MQAHKTKSNSMQLRAAFAGLVIGAVIFCAGSGPLLATTPTYTMSDFTAYPPLLNTATATNQPNMLVVLDNSNRMDEDPNGIPVGSTSAASKSEIARGGIKDLIQQFQGQIRLGLMTYAQDTPQPATLYAALMDSSYNAGSILGTYTPSLAYTIPANPLPWMQGAGWPSYTTPGEPYELGDPNAPGNYVLFYHEGAGYMPGTGNTARYCNGTGTTYGCSANSPNNGKGSGNGNNPWTGNDSMVSWDAYPSSSITDQYGPYETYVPVGTTWLAGGETGAISGNPGGGTLDVPVASLSSSQITTLDSYLATESLTSNTAPPVVNAGNEPIDGTLAAAQQYFAGTLDGVDAPPANSCSAADDYVVLVLGGLPDTDASGDLATSPTAATTDLQAVETEATALASAKVYTYVVAFTPPTSADLTAYNAIAAAGGTNQAYIVSDQSSLDSALIGIASDVMNTSSSGSASAVVTDSANGVGADYQSWYRPSLTAVNTSTGVSSTVNWIGGLYGLFVGPYGYLREDSNGEVSGSYPLAGYQTDKIVKFEYDSTTNQTYVIRYDSTSNTIPQNLTAEAPAPLSSLQTIWNAQDPLAELSDSDLLTNRSYSANTDTGRYIFTSIGGQTTPFTTTSVDSADSGNGWNYLGVSTQTDANNIINYIRGIDQSGFRNRSIDYKQTGSNLTWRLGDIIHSTVAVVGAPDANYGVSDHDTTYTAFQQQYANRRQMIYVGANDGMLHAFNGGFWDATTEAFNLTDPSGTATADPLGGEMWAYVPENLLPQLQWLTSANYTHVYYMDGPIETFDARIFTPDTEHPYGWGTVLVAGMRFGGGPYQATVAGTATPLSSAYVIMDVTDPSQPPTLLAEVNDPTTAFGMGYTTSMPAIVQEYTPDTTTGSYTTPSSDQWYLVFGSGPTNLPNTVTDATSTQDANLYAYDLNTLSWVTGLSPLDTGQATSFVGDLAAQDWNLDGVDDGVYFGTVGGTASAPTGQLDRLVLNSTYSSGSAPGDIMSGAYVSPLLEPNQPFIAAPTFNTDTNGANWVYAGTGRFLSVADDASTAQQTMYGIKEPVDSKGNMTWGTQSVSSMLNVNPYTVYSDNTVSPSGNVINGVTVNTVSDMEQAIQGVNSNPPMAGWYLNLSTGTGTSTSSAERVVTSPFLFDQVLNFTTFQPSPDSCDPQGQSWLYAVDPLSGLAQPFAPLGYNSGVTDHNGAQESVSQISLGAGMAFQGVVHRTTALPSNKATLVINMSHRNVQEISETGGTLVSGRRSWLELPLN